MARLNITLPDVLYARLEQLRDRINLSKVCATALEREVAMLEGQPPITDPRISQLLQRLQSTRERWHQRGYEDGIGWAVDLATRDELQSVATYLADLEGQQLVALFKMSGQPGVAPLPPPSSMPVPPLPPPMSRGTAAAAAGSVSYRVFHKHPASVGPPHPPEPEMVFYHHAGKPFPGFPESFHPDERLQHWQNQDREMSGQAAEGEAARMEVDKSAYLEGWRDAVKGIWQTIGPALS
jgi:ribosome modulation factor